MIYKFTNTTQTIEEALGGSQAYLLHEKLAEVGSFKKLPDEYKAMAKVIFNSLWHHDTYKTGIYKLMGYVIDFRQWLKVYWVEIEHYGIQEIRAFNKTCIRKYSDSPSYIQKIVEIK